MGTQSDMMIKEETKQETIRILERMRELLDEDDANAGLAIEALCTLAIEKLEEEEQDENLQRLLDKDD